MKQILKTVWQTDRKNFLWILLLNIGSALMGSVSIVMLIPMLDLLDVSVGSSGTLGVLLRPFEGLTVLQRSVIIIVIFVLLMLVRAALQSWATVRQNAFLERYGMGLRKSVYDATTKANWENLSKTSGADLIQLITAQCRQATACLQSAITLITSVCSAMLQLAFG